MSNYIEEKLQTKIRGSYDVIVAGGGPAGIGAAIAAARSGAHTLLVEQLGFLGGMWTAGLVNPIFDHRNKKGILVELIEQLKQKNVWGGFIQSSFQYEYMKYILDQMMIQNGVEVLYHTYIADAITEENEIKGIIVQNKEGRQAYTAKVTIDATGDADIACYAGVKFHMGREADKKVQPMTLMFTLGNVNFKQTDCDQLYHLLESVLDKAQSDYTIPYNRPYIIQLPNSNTAVVQLTHIRNRNPVSASDLSKAEMEGRQQVINTFELMKKIPLFRDIELLQTATLIGVRESRRVEGEYTLTIDDLLEGRKFHDGIVDAEFGMDIHKPDDIGQDCLPTRPYQIPYRCLIPKNYNGLLLSGRCISGTHEAMSSYRVTGDCFAMGEAAGYAAYESISQKKDLREVTRDEILAHIR